MDLWQSVPFSEKPTHLRCLPLIITCILQLDCLVHQVPNMFKPPNFGSSSMFATKSAHMTSFSRINCCLWLYKRILLLCDSPSSTNSRFHDVFFRFAPRVILLWCYWYDKKSPQHSRSNLKKGRFGFPFRDSSTVIHELTYWHKV